MRVFWQKTLFQRPQLSWASARDYVFILVGATIQALSLRIFLIPTKLASGGVSGLAQIINHYTDWPIGVMVLIGNVPLFLLGWRYLGGSRFALRTAFAVITFSILVDLPLPFLPPDGLTDDLMRLYNRLCI
jgi:uncharacterized membrane-anchored protein YitT (DUF2179 family)